MRVPKAFTLAELIVTVVMLGALTFVAVPRLSFGSRAGRQAEVTARKIATDLRRTRSLAILHAAVNAEGFALRIKATTKGTEYEIVDLRTQAVVDVHTVEVDVSIGGRTSFAFTPLGALKEQNDPVLTVSGAGQTFTIRVTPGTGAVRCTEDTKT
jgi:Tfp pilus assembly protein FimT